MSFLLMSPHEYHEEQCTIYDLSGYLCSSYHILGEKVDIYCRATVAQ